MKTFKKIFTFFILASLCGWLCSSCEDTTDTAGVDPVIHHVLASDPKAKDSLIVGASADDYIIIVGENLSRVTQVYFDNIPAKDLNPVYITDNYLILKVPEITASTQELTVVTKDGRRATISFGINVPPPTISMFYCEFVPAGGTLRIKGNYFIAPKVYFYGDDGELYDGTVDTQKSNTKEIYVTVPAQAGYSMPIVVENGSGRSESRIIFRDRRNMIVDFDEYRGFGGWLRDWEEEGFPFPTFRDNSGDDGYPPSVYCPNEYLIGNDEANRDAFPQGCDGKYNLLNTWSDNNWQEPGRIQFHIKDNPSSPNPRRDDPLQSKSLMGPFNEFDPRGMVLKFEVYVPKQYPINGAWLYVYFPPAGGDEWDSNSGWGLLSPEVSPVEKQVSLGFWCPFVADINKTDEPWKWEFGDKCKEPFHTNDTWMTVAVPLSKVLFHGWVASPGANLHKGDTGNPYGDWTDAGNPSLSPNTVLSQDPTKALGDMIVQYPTWSGKGNQSGKFMLFVDNFRLVPEDGGGAVYGRGTGVERAY